MNWNVPFAGFTEESGHNSSASRATALTTSYTEFESATDYEWPGFTFLATSRTVGADTDFTIALGAAAAEFPIVDRMLMSNGGSTYAHSRVIHCPVRVPKGSRVAVKIGTTFTTLYGQIFGWAAAMPGACASAAFLERVGTAGTGVSVDAGAVLNTKGSWTSLGSNTYAWNGMFVNVLSGDSGTGVDFNVDIGIDLAGTKFIIVPDLYVTKGSGSTVNPFAVPLPCSVPAGSNLYARIQASTTTSTSRKLGICLHGMVT